MHSGTESNARATQIAQDRIYDVGLGRLWALAIQSFTHLHVAPGGLID